MTKKRERDIDEINGSNGVKKSSTSSNVLNIDLLSKKIAEIMANYDGYLKDEIDNKLSALLLRAIKERKIDCVALLLDHKAQVSYNFVHMFLFD